MGMIACYEYGRRREMNGNVVVMWVMKWGKECGCQADTSCGMLF